MDLVDVNIHTGYVLCGHSLKAGKENGLLTKLVNYYKGHVVAIFFL